MNHKFQWNLLVVYRMGLTQIYAQHSLLNHITFNLLVIEATFACINQHFCMQSCQYIFTENYCLHSTIFGEHSNFLMLTRDAVEVGR